MCTWQCGSSEHPKRVDSLAVGTWPDRILLESIGPGLIGVVHNQPVIPFLGTGRAPCSADLIPVPRSVMGSALSLLCSAPLSGR